MGALLNMTPQFVTARWVASKAVRGFRHLDYITKADADRALELMKEEAPSFSVYVPDPGAPHGKREFLITVEEQK